MSSHKTILTELGPLPKASSEPCGCDKRGDRTFFCTYHQGAEDEREACAKLTEQVRAEILTEDYAFCPELDVLDKLAEQIRKRGTK